METTHGSFFNWAHVPPHVPPHVQPMQYNHLTPQLKQVFIPTQPDDSSESLCSSKKKSKIMPPLSTPYSHVTSHGTPHSTSHPTPHSTLHSTPHSTLHATPHSTLHATPHSTLHAIPHSTLHAIPHSTTSSVWSHLPPQNPIKTPFRDLFKERPGPRGEALMAKDVEKAFGMFIDDDMLEFIVEQTNKQMAANRLTMTLTPALRATHTETCKAEIKCFLGLWLYRGLHQETKERAKQLWYESTKPFYRACMSLNRFQFLLRNLTFHDIVTLHEASIDDQFATMRWLVDEFELRARRYYRHTAVVSIGETLVNSRTVKCEFLTALSEKPAKKGIVFRTIVDSTDRYVSRLIPYIPLPNESKSQSKEDIQDLVLELANDVLNTGRTVTGDRLYPSIETAEELFRRKTKYVGPIRDFKEREVSSTQFFWKNDSPVMVLSYCPKPGQNTVLLTTAHDKPDMSKQAVPIPEVISFFNLHRGGVDTVNDMLKEFSSKPITNHWSTVVFSFITDLACINGNTVLNYNLPEHKRLSRIEFLENLSKKLVVPWMLERVTNKGLLLNVRESLKTVLTNFNSLPVELRQQQLHSTIKSHTLPFQLKQTHSQSISKSQPVSCSVQSKGPSMLSQSTIKPLPTDEEEKQTAAIIKSTSDSQKTEPATNTVSVRTDIQATPSESVIKSDGETLNLPAPVVMEGEESIVDESTANDESTIVFVLSSMDAIPIPTKQSRPMQHVSQYSKARSAKCRVCLKSLIGLPTPERRRLKSNKNKVKWFCPVCNEATCPSHRVIIPGRCCCVACFEKYNIFPKDLNIPSPTKM